MHLPAYTCVPPVPECSPQAPGHLYPRAPSGKPAVDRSQPCHMSLSPHTHAHSHVPLKPISPMRVGSEPWHVGARIPLWGAACPSPRLSGVPGTAGIVPTHRNRHSCRIASAANFSSAVHMMINCYCARETSKEGFISVIVRKDSMGSSAHNSKAGLTPCVPEDTTLTENEGPGDGCQRWAHASQPQGREHWGGRHESGGCSKLIPCLPCSLGPVSFTKPSLTPCHRIIEAERPWSLNAWGWDGEWHFRPTKPHQQGPEGLEAQGQCRASPGKRRAGGVRQIVKGPENPSKGLRSFLLEQQRTMKGT